MSRSHGKSAFVAAIRSPGSASVHPITRSLLLVIAGVILSSSLPGAALALGDDIYVSAFVSQGYFKSSEYDYLIENSRRGSAEFNEAAVSLLMDPADRFRLGIQLFSRDLGDIGNNTVRISWAFGDYRWRDWLGFRGGKIKMQMGLYNIGREADMLRTPIFLPSSVYTLAYRDFTLATEGFSVYGSTTAGDWGSLDYEVFGGALNIPDPNNSIWKKNFASGTAADIAAARYMGTLPEDTDVEYVSTTDVIPTFPWVYGAYLMWNTPMDGLRLAGFFNSGEYEMNYRTLLNWYDLDPATGERGDPDLRSLPQYWRDRYYLSILSLEYTIGDFIFAFEHNNFSQDKTTANAGQYLMVTWDACEHWSFTSYVSNFVIDVSDPDGDGREQFGFPDFAGWQREAVVAARVNITPNWLVKAEFHAVDGVANVLYLDAIEGSERYWTQMALKTTFHF